MRPPYPLQQGDSPCTRSAIEKTDCTNFFPHETSGNGKRAHGHNENEENAGRESLLSHRLFSIVFPGCFASGRRRNAAQPVARSVGIQLAKSQLSFCKGVSAWRLCRSQFAKIQSFICENLCACFFVSPGNYLCDTNCYFRKKGPGAMPLVGCGAKPRMVPHASPGNRMKDTVCCIRNWVQGTALVSLPGVEGATPLHGSPAAPIHNY